MRAGLPALLAVILQGGWGVHVAQLHSGLHRQQHRPDSLELAPSSKPSQLAEHHQRPKSPPVGLPDHGEASQMFVAVFSRKDAFERRVAVRQVWAFPANVSAKFVICHPPPTSAGGGAQEARDLAEESGTYADVMFLNCTEGYATGLLTKKLLAALKTIHREYVHTPLIYKADDDTLPDLRKLVGMCSTSAKYIYAGVWRGASPVSRIKGGRWYEPFAAFPRSQYPPSATGGPGYVLSRPLVDYFLSSGVAEKNMLWNEDKAVGVWADLASKAGLSISRVKVSGSEGFGKNTRCDLMRDHTRATYNLTLFHHLSVGEMQCFKRVNRTNETFGQCFCKGAGRSAA